MTNVVFIWLAVVKINNVRDERTEVNAEDTHCGLCVGVCGVNIHRDTQKQRDILRRQEYVINPFCL